MFNIYWTSHTKQMFLLQALVNKWRRHAYDKLDGISPDFVLRNDIPKPISSSTDFAAAPSVLAVGTSTSRQIFSANQLAPYQGYSNITFEILTSITLLTMTDCLMLEFLFKHPRK